MSNIKLLKEKIKQQLDILVTAGKLQGCAIVDMRKDPLAGDIPPSPYAFLMPPSTESSVVDNRTLLRTYRFDILVMVKGENINTATYIEELIEAILNQFDNNPTLDGEADGAVEPASSTPEPINHKNGEYTLFFVTLRANRTETLTY